MRRFAILLGLSAALATGGCKARSTALLTEDTQQCTGAGPVCHAIASDGCCAAEPQPAECGPKDAPLGTHLKWVCPGKLVVATECRGIGAACAPRPPQRNDSSGAPHAAVSLEVFNPDAAIRIPDAGREGVADASAKKPPKHR